ncbi:MAG: 3-deoxy-manno-octulosonate cytidylyltransferase, partial [Bacteroidales bacterium]|nr:3-deoxy-manno-octulosonate cytidylyltransferase [Bacteroidales bacterium]
MEFIAIIPARFGSTRFPGKPLVQINNKSMVHNVYVQASLVFDEVWVATDDVRIVNEVESFGGNVVLTKKKHKSGTDRCA